MDKRKLIFIKGIYDTMDLFTDELMQAFGEMGYPIMALDAECMEESLEGLSAYLGVPCRKNPTQADLSGTAACIAFNNMGYNLCEDMGFNLWEQYGIPYYNIQMDHPFHYADKLRCAPSTTRLYCIDRGHVGYVKRFFPNIPWVDFLPHAGTAVDERDMEILPLEKRPVDVLYAGSLSKYRIELLIPDFEQFRGFDAGELCSQVLQELVAHPSRTTEEVLEQYLGELELPISEEQLGSYISQFRFLDAYAVSFFREQAVRLLVESGIRVAVYGEGWDLTDWSDNPNLVFCGKVTAPEILPLMHQSKIVLNTLTWFKDGSHDRIFNGMLAGAVVVTDSSRYLKEQFENHKELEFFELEEIGGLPAIVDDVLGDLQWAQQIADRGRMAAQKNHTWAHRAKEIERTFA
jgi:hypothetical protein